MVVVMIFQAMAQVWRSLLQREWSHWYKLGRLEQLWFPKHPVGGIVYMVNRWRAFPLTTGPVFIPKLYSSLVFILSLPVFYPLLVMINFDIWFNDYSALLLRIVGFTTSRKVVLESFVVFFCHSRPQIPETTLYYWFSAFEIQDSWSKRQPREFSRVTVWRLFFSCAWALSV